MMSRTFPQSSTYAARIDFMVELASHLHRYGTTAQRIEGALVLVAQRLEIGCEPWSNPTGLILAFSDPERPGDSETTRVIRLPPGDTNLHKLCEADHIAEAVMAGTVGLAEGHAALRALDRPPARGESALLVVAFGMTAAALSGLLRLPWLDIATAGSIGVLIGLVDVVARNRPRLREAADAISAMVAGFVAILVAGFVAPLNLNSVIISSLIVLLPGMALTNSVNELTSQHLLSGAARFAGAVTTLLKLTLGTMIALSIAHLAGVEPRVRAWRPQPELVEWAALVLAALSFAILFRASRRDYPVVMVAAMSGYLISRVAGNAWGSPVGIFLSALLVTAAGNAYARWGNRPGAVVRVPGIIMLVPGSASLRGIINLMQQQDIALGQEAALAVLNILLALIAGLLFGNLMMPTRRNL